MVKENLSKVICSSKKQFEILLFGPRKKRDGCWMRRVMQSYIFLFALTILLLSSSSSWAVIYISNITDLQKIGNDPGYPLNGEYELTQDIDASDTSSWNSGAGFNPIGTLINPFIGKLDGKGYKITSLYINRPSTDTIGLFGCIASSSELKDLGIEDCQIVGSWDVGGLVGHNEGVVSGCYSTGTVSSEWEVGGLVGWNDGGTVNDCYSTGTVSGDNDVGGLVGNNEGTVSNSYAMGSVAGSGSYIGGLIGYLYGGSITNTYSTGAVGGSGSDKGGLIGYRVSGTVTSSYWDTETSGQSSSSGGTGKTTAEMKQQATYVGWDFTTVWGIVEHGSYPYLLWQGGPFPIQIDSIEELQLIGNDPDYPLNMHYELSQDIDASDTVNWNGGAGFNPVGTDINPFKGKFDGNEHKIIGLYINRPSTFFVGLFGYTGSGSEIKDLGIDNCLILSKAYIGGLVGRNGGTVSGCYNTGTVSGDGIIGGLVGLNSGSVSGSYSTGTVSGNDDRIGGLVGMNDGTVCSSYSTGSVSGGTELAGGLIGDNLGIVSDCYSTGSVSGDNDVGGLIGRNHFGSVIKSYSIGFVSGSDYVGGLVGYSYNSTVSDSYWDTETSGQSSSSGGTGKTTAEMKQQATYVGWDFTTVWGIVEHASYPYLLWQGGPFPIQIDSIEELQLLGNDPGYPLSMSYELSQDIDASDTISWNGGAGFAPIGTWSSPFTGKFDGKGHKITGLYINRPLANYIGLFGHTGSGSEVNNIGIEECQIIGDNYVGALVGLKEGAISNCYSTGIVEEVSNFGGGLVGGNYGMLTNSYSTCTVETIGTFIGGLVGTNDGIITNSYSIGSVKGDSFIGGLIGYNSGTLSNSYSTGSVEGNANIGGLVGLNSGMVSDCYWNIETSGQSSSSGGEGKTTEEMRQQITYIGWDFTNTWGIIEGSCYPYLLWQGGPLFVFVPNLEGMTQTDAEAEIINSGLTVGTISEECNDTIPAGNVISQTPVPDEHINPGAEVHLVVSIGICIDSIEELQLIGNDPAYPINGTYALISDINANDTVNWNGGMGFDPILLTGRFDGRGHKIRNIYINRPDEDYVGLIGRLYNGGEVKNLGIEDSRIVGDDYVGALVGSNGGTVNGCYSTGHVSGGNETGGLIGWNDSGMVSSCYSTGPVEGDEFVGGLLGQNDSGMVSNCYSTGPVWGEYGAGGLVGWNYGGTVNDCYSIGAVSVGEDVGGLVGYNEGTVSNSYWDVETSGQSSSDGGEGKTTTEMKQQATYVNWDFTDTWTIEENVSYPYLRTLGPTIEEPPQTVQIDSIEELEKIGVDPLYPWWWNYELMVNIDASDTVNWDGGKGFKPIRLAGKFDGKGHKIQNLYINRPDEDNVGFIGRLGKRGEVKDLGIESCQIVGFWIVSGLVGMNEGTVNGSYSTGTVSGREHVGGLVGANIGGTVSGCYSTGTVSGSRCVGGLTGYNSGTVSNSYAMGSVEGSDRDIGGLIGGLDYGSVSNTYSTGTVGGSGENKGGLIGYIVSGTITSSYWNMETSGMSTSAGGEGKTTAEMIQKATFSGWDFTNVWGIIEDASYPCLLWQGSPLFVFVPDVEGLSQGEAESAIIGAALSVGTVTEQCSDTVPTGNVISQDPTGGQQVTPGTAVDLVISTGGPCPIQIDNIEELQLIGNDPGYPLSGEYELTQDIDASDTINWNDGAGFNPIGTYGNPFTGNFDGKGYKITGLYINRLSTSYMGLFGYTGPSSEIKDLGMENFYFAGYWNVGGLIGYKERGSVSNCYSMGTVYGDYYVGGLIGNNEVGTVTNCYSTGTVSGNYYIGGLIGFTDGTVLSCGSTGTVSGDYYVGGLVGQNYSIVSNSYSTGTVSGNYYVGGLVGQNRDTVLNCYSIGAVSGGHYGGGLVGWNGGTVSSSYWDVQTSGQSSSAGGEGKTTIEMKQQATFVGWDFTDVWGIVENVSYPYLLWQGGPFVFIPNIVGMTQNNASSAIIGCGLTVGTITQQCSDTVPAGSVISQEPTGGQQVPPLTEVDFVVSTGPCPEGEGTQEGEGMVEGEGTIEGTPEGIPEGMVEGEGSIEGEGIVEGEGVVEGEGTPEGSPEGEGIIEGEGTPEGTPEGEGTVEGEGMSEGEGSAEGEKPPHSADPNGDWQINLSELLRVIQFFNFQGYHCALPGEESEDGYMPGYDGDKTCTPHTSDYNTQDWIINLSELLRLIQFFNTGGYHPCPDGEDGYCPGL